MSVVYPYYVHVALMAVIVTVPVVAKLMRQPSTCNLTVKWLALNSMYQSSNLLVVHTFLHQPPKNLSHVARLLFVFKSPVGPPD